MNERIEKLAAQTMDSLNGAERAQPKPFLLTRVMAAISNKSNYTQSTWTKVGAFISRPSVAVAAVCLIIALNTSIMFIEKNHTNNSSQSSSRDEFAVNTATIYDLENPEQ